MTQWAIGHDTPITPEISGKEKKYGFQKRLYTNCAGRY